MTLIMLTVLASCFKETKDTAVETANEVTTAAVETVNEVVEVAEESMEKATDTEDAMMEKEEDSMDKIDDDKMMEEEAMMEKGEDSAATMEEEVMMDKGDESMEKEETMTKELAGSYAEYDDSMLGETENTVIFFHASWCPSCRAADSGISEGEVPEGLTILKADFDSATDLRKKYSVVGQHTFVQVDADGNEIKKWLGWNSVAEVVERLQ